MLFSVSRGLLKVTKGVSAPLQNVFLLVTLEMPVE